MENNHPKRLDQYLVEHGLVETRNKAAWMIEQGWVYINGKVQAQKSYKVSATDRVELRPDRRIYVSQGGYKLEKAIREFNLDFTGTCIMDVGASTGGFTDCALQHGAARVVAIDIGEGQLHPLLAKDERVTSLEKTDIRNIEPADLPVQYPINIGFDFILVDVSFISLEFVFPFLQKFMAPGVRVVALLKPQFEQAERRKHKHGIIKSEKVRLSALEKIQAHIFSHGLGVQQITTTDADGVEKNIEYLLLLKPEK